MAKMTLDEAKACADAGTVTGLRVTEAISVADLAAFPNLTSLSLTGNRKLRELDALASLRKLEELWIDDLGLTAIPEALVRLERLRLLFLGKNELKDFSLLKRMPGLEDLGLEELALKKLPDEVLGLKKLRILGIYGNSLGTLAPLGKLPELEEIYAAKNELKQIPPELAALKKLRKLDVMHNYRLTSFGALGELRSLEDLSVTNAHAVPKLPAAIFSLEKLKSLTIAIHWNAPPDELEGLADIGRLGALESLHMTGAAMTSLPAAFGTLENLVTLDLSDSKLLADVNPLAGLPRLTTLDLNKCEKLADVSGLRDLPALQTLKLASTDVTTIPETFSSLKALRSLEVAHNKRLASIPGLRDLPALESLTLFTSMRSLPAELGTLGALKQLKLSAKGATVDFVGELGGLEELYVAECALASVPPLPKVQKLTLYRNRTADDASLAHLPALTELMLSQPAVKLPVLPSLRTLTLRNLASDELDLTSLREMPALRELTIEVCDHLKTIPAAVATASGLEKLTFDMLDEVVDLAGLAGSPARELRIDGCEKLTALPASLAEMPRLAKLHVKSCDALTDLTVLGRLAALEELRLERLERIVKLPSMKDARALRRVALTRLGALKDVGGLSDAPALEHFEANDCSKLSASAAAALTNRLRGAAPLRVGYADFMKETYRTLTGKEDAKHAYRFPLAFGTPAELLETMEGFSWLDDHRDDGEGDLQSMLAGEESAMVPLAVLDFGFAGCEDETIDSYAEEVFLVDTADAQNPVYLWGHDGSPRKIHASFDEFLASLRDFAPRGETKESSGTSGGALASLVFVEGTSSKFWKIVVDGSSHTVTYGKIGTAGTSKTKSFDSAAAASKDANKLVAEKRGKGYRDA